jgi:hypothetical protein
MPLTYTGERNDTMSGTTFRATGDRDEVVVVTASHEVLQDRGDDAVLQKGSDKYDAGNAQANRIRVTNADFA